ncbi:ABC transporter permease subunit [Paenibacillus eucommiae]|uniref:ABC-type sugar transport system permease subunit n=1 Tax=Paenibacillus eucommiae TaxID=1355755 RepID=A0ABS4IM05_9BACL|nr:ABC transporter permease subunit [Paenibacillus eucommiae]MBP1988597.1 ABC-type sugar transport system permease subunit [Paenibacillus eucommiae]
MSNLMKERSSSPNRKGSRRLWIGIIILILLASSVYLVMDASKGRPYEVGGSLSGVKIFKAVELQEGTTLAITTDSRLLLLDGTQIQIEKEIKGTITDMAVSTDRSHIYVGTNDRNVYVLDPLLQEIGSFPVNGKVIGLDATIDGGINVAYGIGQYTNKFWVGQFDEAGNAIFKTKVGIDVTTITTGKDGSYFGTVDSKVGLLSPDGKELWRTNLIQPITRLSLNANQELLAADERGNVSLLSAKGKVIWTQSLSAYPITMLDEAKQSGHIIVGDKDGSLFILNTWGNVLYQANFNKGAISSLIHNDEKELIVITDQGRDLTINLHQALQANTQNKIKTGLIIMDLILVLTAIGISISSVPAWRKAAIQFGRRLKRSRTAYLLLLPSIALIIVFNITPTLMAVFYSFTNFSLKEPLKVIGLANFVKLGSDSFFWVGMWNMILIIVTSILKELTMPLLAAELIFWLRSSKLKYVFRTAFVVPSIVPGVVVVLLWKMMYEPETGLINQFLGVLGLGALQHAWLGDENLAIWSIIAAGFPFISVFAFLIYFGGLIGISRDIYDSSAIDGINAWGRFWKIDVPLIRPQIRLILFFTFIGSIQGFANIFIFTRGGPGTATYVPGLQMYNQISSANFGYASAIGVVLAILVLAGSILNVRFSKQERE